MNEWFNASYLSKRKKTVSICNIIIPQSQFFKHIAATLLSIFPFIPQGLHLYVKYRKKTLLGTRQNGINFDSFNLLFQWISFFVWKKLCKITILPSFPGYSNWMLSQVRYFYGRWCLYHTLLQFSLHNSKFNIFPRNLDNTQ